MCLVEGSSRPGFSGGKYEGFGMVAAATNKGYIRFISGGGVQEYIMSAAGDVVSMVGGNEWVFIVHREGGTSLDGEYMLG